VDKKLVLEMSRVSSEFAEEPFHGRRPPGSGRAHDEDVVAVMFHPETRTECPERPRLPDNLLRRCDVRSCLDPERFRVADPTELGGSEFLPWCGDPP